VLSGVSGFQGVTIPKVLALRMGITTIQLTPSNLRTVVDVLKSLSTWRAKIRMVVSFVLLRTDIYYGLRMQEAVCLGQTTTVTRLIQVE